MPEEMVYRDTGEHLFADNVPIYINRVVEQVQSHLHAHEYIEIAYVSEGKGIHRIGGREFTVSKGDLFVINYDVPHEFRSVPSIGDGRLVVSNCVFKPEFIDGSLIRSRCFSDISHIFLFNSLFREEAADNDIHILGRDSAEVEELYDRMYAEYQAKRYGYAEILRAYVLELLVRIFRLYHERASVPDPRRRMFDNAIHFMKNHYRQDIRLEDLAAMTFLSRNYFCTCFKECTGMTVLEYIQKLRIEEACSLLREDDKTITEIAGEVGYHDMKFFYKTFKKITGKAPGEYRAQTG